MSEIRGERRREGDKGVRRREESRGGKLVVGVRKIEVNKNFGVAFGDFHLGQGRIYP